MTMLRYEPDPSSWTQIPANPDNGWAASSAADLAHRQGADDPAVISNLMALLEAASGIGRGDEDARWVCTTNVRRGGIVVDMDVLDLGDDAPEDVSLDDEAGSGQLEEFSAGNARGKRIVWVTPAGEDTTDILQGQVLYVARITDTGYLITMRSGQHPLDLIVESVAACEDMLGTMTVS